MNEIINKLYTIGVYGSTEDSFFDALIQNKITVFCDIRARRGLRGKKYAYANSMYLQQKLAQLNITYRHFKGLSPSIELRDEQARHDKENKIARRDRQVLGNVFTDGYRQDVLDDFDVFQFLHEFKADDNIVLFCVEKEPTVCHRSLLAQKISDVATVMIEHIIP